MNFFAFLFILLLNSVLSENECKFESRFLSNLQSIEKCLRTVPYDPQSEEIKGIKQTILDVLKSYAYTDQLLSLPEEFKDQQTDIIADIEGIKPEDYNNYYDYNRGLAKAIYKVRDSHFGYKPPCFDNFLYYFPFSFKIQMDNKGNPILVGTDTTFLGINLSGVYIYSGSGRDDIRGKTITTLVLPDLDVVDNEPAAVTFSRWSQKYGSLRTPLGRQSLAVQQQFSIRFFHTSDYPDRPVIIRYLDDDNNERTTQIPFFAFIANTDASPENICPFESSSKSSFSSSFVSLLNKEREKIKNESNENVDFNNEFLIDSNYKDDKTDLLVKMRVNEIRESYERLEREGKLDEFKDNNGTKLHYIKKDEYSDMYKKAKNITLKNRISSDERENGKREREEDNDDSDSYLYLNNSDGVSYTVVPDKQLLMFTVPTWEIQDLVGFLDVLEKGLTLALDKKCDKLIINKIGNTGGDILLSYFLFSLLFQPQFPSEYVASFPVTETNSLCGSYRTRMRQIASYPENKRIIKLDDYKPYRNVTVSGEIGGEKRERTREWSRKYYLMYGEYLKHLLSYVKPSFIDVASQVNFKPENTIILLDGVCISACAMFSKYASQKKLATTLNYGYTIYNPDNKKSDIGDACSEEVVDLKKLYERQNEMKSSYSLPSKFKRTEGLISFPVGAKYSANKEEEDVMMEFKLIEADTTINDFIDYENLRHPDYLTKLALIVSEKFNYCVSWNVKTNESCKGPSEGEKVKNGIYGNPCDTSTSSYDLNKCVFARCENGYYLDDGKCKKLPDLDYDSPLASLLNLVPEAYRTATIVLGIIVGLFVIACIVGLIILICRCCCSCCGCCGGDSDNSV